MQEKTTGIGNVGKSPCEGTYAENQSLKVQGNLREHSVVAHQEDIPTGDCAGIHPLPNAPDPLAVMNSITEMFLKHQTLGTLYFECARECAVDAAEIAMVFPDTEEDRTVHMELLRKSVARAVTYALELSKSFLVILEGLNEAAPHIRDPLTRMWKRSVEIITWSVGRDQNIKSELWKSKNEYGQLLFEWEV